LAQKLADAFVRIYTDQRDLDSGLNEAKQKVGSASSIMQGVFQGVGQAIFNQVKQGITLAIGEIGKAVQASSNLNETINKTGVVFGSAAGSVVDWSKTTANSLGISQRAALDAAGGFGALFRQMGQIPDVAAEQSQTLVKLAADLGSIYNIENDRVLGAIQSGLAGQSEPLRALNIFLNETAVAQEAVAIGAAKSTKSVDEAAKVQARYSLILKGAAIAQGDFSNTSGGLANATKRLQTIMEDGAASIGNSFRPAVESIVNSLIGVAPQMFSYGQNITDQLANGLAAGIRAILPVIQTVRQLFTYWFAPGSPPRVLPDIDKWGAAAMGQFLKGFSSVDVKSAFDSIGSAIESILRSNVSAGKMDQGSLVSTVFGTRDAIVKAVAEFARAGSVSESTINKIVRSAGSAGTGIGALVKAYFDVQKASTAATRAQDDLNRITEKYNAILDPLRDQLDGVRSEQQKLADQQRLIAAQNTLTNFDSTDAEKRAAALEIQQISLESQISTAEQKQKTESAGAQTNLDNAKKEETAAQKQLDIAQATIDQQVQTNTLLGEQLQYEKKLADEREAETKKQEALAQALHQAQLQYQLGIATTEGKLALLRGELTKTTEGSAEWYSLQGQIAALEKQSAEETKRNADKITDAQLQYNLELADTAGKIAIWQGELSKATEGSAEYYNILSKIHALQDQAAKEGGGGSSSIADFALPKPEDMPKLADSLGGKNLAKALEEAFAPIPAASANVSMLADKISILVDKIGLLFGVDFSTWTTNTTTATTIASDSFALYGQKAAEANSSVGVSTDSTVEKISGAVDVLTALVNGDWATLWQMYKTHALEAYSETDKDTQAKLDRWQFLFDLFAHTSNLTWTTYWAEWRTIWDTGFGLVKLGFETILTGLTSGLSKWFTDATGYVSLGFVTIGKSFYDGGAKMITQFLDGLKSSWGDVSSWFTGKLSELRAQLPFSEPKDPSSPLRGLAKSGAAMVDMFQSGINSASLNIDPLANSLLASPQGSMSSTTNGDTVFNFGGITITGAANVEDVRKGLVSGLDDVLTALRARGA
jgi:phage host-nuclease inhibitor protein Gam